MLYRTVIIMPMLYAREIRLEFRPIDTIIGSLVYVQPDRPQNDSDAGANGRLTGILTFSPVWLHSPLIGCCWRLWDCRFFVVKPRLSSYIFYMMLLMFSNIWEAIYHGELEYFKYAN